MKRLFLAVLFLCISVAAEETQPSLTIYNQNFVVVRERLPLDLKPGVNQIEFKGITAHLEPDSVLLRDPAGRALQILEQNYRNDPISQELLLSRYVGKTIDFIVEHKGAKIETVKGKIIRSGYIPSSAYNQGYQTPGMGQPIIEVDGVLRFGLPGQPLFPALDSDSILKPTLNWLLQTIQPGAFDAEISYVSGGMSWQADYNLVIADKNEGRSNVNLVDLVGWVTMHNQSGKAFENARIKLMAGDVNKIANQLAVPRAAAVMKMADEANMAPVVREKSFDEFHLYTLERATTLRDEETKQVEFVRATGVRSQRLYVYDGAALGYYSYYNSDQILQDPSYGTQSNPRVWVMQEFKNSEGNHLGVPLPKGRLRFYRRDTDGHLEFIGENTIDHTPKDETIRLYTGNAFDVTGERKRTNFRADSHQHWMDESFEIRVRNHKKEPVQVRVLEHLYRWTNWKMVENSDDYRKKDAQTVEFPVTIAPDGEQVVAYTVHYSW
ncbi:MAG TPA: hypothetical protein VJX16_27265 [Terriglobales bacterium]|nr:hypothetical protein [Terriglobales bacterium]